MKYTRLDDEAPLSHHQGVFRKQITLFQAVALIISATIGAGVLGIPYAVSKVGLVVGLGYIVILGVLMMALNLLIGEVASRAGSELQLVGLAKKYLGKVGGGIMTVLVYSMSFGILVVYIIGEGETLATLFGGDKFWWSFGFFVIGGILIASGMRTLKTVELFLSMGILMIILIIAGIGVPHITIPNIVYSNLAYLLLPYGVILFAFSGANSIPEAHSLLKDRDKLFKHAIIIAGIVAIVAYALFAFVVVGVTGAETTEIATIGLGNKVGKSLYLFGNLFAILAMGTSFLMGGLSLRDSLRWDYKISNKISTLLVCGLPFLIFLAGLRNFIEVIDIVGGVFVSLEMLFLILIYWRAKHLGDLKKSKFGLHHTWLLVILLGLALTTGAVYSVFKLF